MHDQPTYQKEASKVEGTIKKVLMLVLSLAVVLAMSAPVFADTSTVTKVSTTQQLTTAVAKGGSIQLQNDITASITIPAGKTVTLDLNGKTLMNDSNKDTITVENGATLNLDSSNGQGVVNNTSHGYAALYNSGEATVGNVKLYRSEENGSGNTFYTILNHGKLTIDGALVQNSANKSSLIDNGYSSYNSGSARTGYVSGKNAKNPELIINSGTFDGGVTNIKNDDGGIVTINGGSFKGARNAILNWNKMTINDGDFTAKANLITNRRDESNKSSDGEILNAGELTINGGKFTATPVSGDATRVFPIFGVDEDGTQLNGYDKAAKTIINGGTFTDRLDNENNELDITVTGGTFYSKPVDSDVATGSIVRQNSDGTYSVYKVNSWTKELSIDSWTYGDTAKTPSAEAKYGTVTYKYYDSDKKELGSEQPTDAGNYYVKAFVAEGAYYTSLESDYVAFTIAKASDSKLTKDLTISSWTYGQTPSTPSAEAADGTITYKYYDKDGNLLTEAPTLPGTYYVTAYVTGATDTEDFETAKVKFTIYKPVLNAKAQKKTKTSDKITWTKVKGADGYVVYYGKCGKSMKKIASTKKSLSTVKKHLAKGKSYKYQVKAYKVVDGKKVVIAKSFKMHAIANGYNSKYTDAKSVKVADSSITIKLNKSKKIKPSLTKYKSGKKFLSSKHAPRYRYQSSDKTVAVVSTSGKVSAVKTGSCKIYVCAPNGVWKTVKVKVVK